MSIKNRKLNRLKDYDYSQNEYYCIPICTKDRYDYLEKINHENMILNRVGEFVKEQWFWSNERITLVNTYMDSLPAMRRSC